MDLYLIDWLNLLLRWAHVVVAIAWIGASFYFVFLDNSLTPPQDEASKARGVTGELWAVHGGGFYHPQKYMVAPPAMPEKLHWFYWESYATWLTGFGLFTLLYLLQAGTYLIDPKVHAWSTPSAVAAALAVLVVFWVTYDVLCRTLGQGPRGDRNVGLGVTLLVVATAVAACELFAGRAAFLIVGAAMATAMSANVFVWIIPGQRQVIAQMRAGAPVDPVHGRRGKQRSVHNTYFGLPVLVAMLSNHHAFLSAAPHNATVLLLLMAAGALIRHSFVARRRALVQGRRVPWEHAIVGVLLLIVTAVWLRPTAHPKSTQADAPVTLAQVQTIIDQRCVVCHNATLQNKGVALHTTEQVKQQALAIYQQAVVLKQMPMNNATQITDDERDALRRWFEASAGAR
ncbi:MAG: urate hydroxylase PuuD [Burkholderiaceae bacterium]|nr:urate hydroxylase PuuD [Burkholderiaceae bacterium]